MRPPGPHAPLRPLGLEELRRRERARRRRQAQVRRNRAVAGTVLSAVVAGSIFAALGRASSPLHDPGSLASLPAPKLVSLVGSRLVVPGPAPRFVWALQGEGAVGVRGIGLIAHSAREKSVPIASLTKMMTAYVILHDHPLRLNEQGPRVTMTRADVVAWQVASQNDDSNVEVKAGEVLSEHQLLEALLIPSADNIADLLARWDAKSIPAFVAKMNATARRLGLRATHYADASGLNPNSRSNAADQVRLASDLMSNPVVRQIVAHPSLPFPVEGAIHNYNPALGVDGIIGVKSGFTGQAEGCLVTAAFRDVGGRSVLVVAATLGQLAGLYGAATIDGRLVNEAAGALRLVSVLRPSEAVASVRIPWAPGTLLARAPREGAQIVGWPQMSLSERLVPVSGARLAAGASRSGAAGRATTTSGARASSSGVSVAAGEPGGTGRAHGPLVGALQLRGAEGLVATVPLGAASAIPPVPAGWSPAAD